MRIRWLWLAGHDSCWCYTICHPMSSGQCHSLTRTSLKMCNKVPWQIYARDVKGILGQTHGVPRKDLLSATETLMVQPKFILWIFEAFIVSARSGLLKAQCFWLQDFLWIGFIGTALCFSSWPSKRLEMQTACWSYRGEVNMEQATGSAQQTFEIGMLPTTVQRCWTNWHGHNETTTCSKLAQTQLLKCYQPFSRNLFVIFVSHH